MTMLLVTLRTYDLLLPAIVIGKTSWTGREVYESDLAKRCFTDGWTVQLSRVLTVNRLARTRLTLTGWTATRERRHALHRLTSRRCETHAVSSRTLSGCRVPSGSASATSATPYSWCSLPGPISNFCFSYVLFSLNSNTNKKTL